MCVLKVTSLIWSAHSKDAINAAALALSRWLSFPMCHIPAREWSDRTPLYGVIEREKEFRCWVSEWVWPSSHFFSGARRRRAATFSLSASGNPALCNRLKFQFRERRDELRARENVMHHAHAGANYFSSPAALDGAFVSRIDTPSQ
jgi:hypothetical protein